MLSLLILTLINKAWCFNENLKTVHYSTVDPGIDEEIPADLATTLESKYYGYIEFRSVDIAFEFVTDYFPRKDEVSDDTYWYHCYVVRPDGVIEYENEALRKGKNV